MFDPKEVAQIKDETQRWQSTTLKKTLDRFPERQAEFVTTSSAPVERLYTPADIAGHGLSCATSASPASIPTRAASTPPCTAASCGPCACSPASARPRRPTTASSYLLGAGPDRPLRRLRHADALRLRQRRTRGRWASSASAAWRSARWPTWRSCSTASRWARSPPP